MFAQQVASIARAGDVVVALSTSGRSPSVVRAAAVAIARGAHVVAFTGAGNSRTGFSNPSGAGSARRVLSCVMCSN